jgi:UDP-2,3-diacylglucosamine pyrophosphatase LpxH
MLPIDLGEISPDNPLKLRTIWLSDIHLGNNGCQVDFLLHFLRCTETKYLFLVGDIIDMWSMQRRLYWPQKHNNAIRSFLGKAKHKTKVVFIPGNHDEKLREYCGLELGNISIQKQAVHTLANGRKLLILHGDEFDGVIGASRFIGKLGSVAYDLLLSMNVVLNWARRHLGLGHWSLSAYLKLKVKNAVKFISNYETAVIRQATRQRVDAVVCGHIHHAEIAPLGGLLYCNCGDWVESCSALVETMDGTLSLLKWNEQPQLLRQFVPAQWAELAALGNAATPVDREIGEAVGEGI